MRAGKNRPAYRRWRPVPSGGGSGRSSKLALPFPSAWRFRDLPLACRSLLPFHRAETPLSFCRSRPLRVSPEASRHSLHLRFARVAPGSSRGVFSDAAAGIAATSIRYVFPIRFSGFPPHLQVRFHRLDKGKLRFKTESRKQKMRKLSTGRPLCVDNPVDSRHWPRFCAANSLARLPSTRIVMAAPSGRAAPAGGAGARSI